MEGFWTMHFAGVQGWGTGVATLVDGQMFGGDSGFTYIGTYTQDGKTMKARLHVKQYAVGAIKVMGLSEFDLQLSGTLNGDNITVTGGIPGTPLQLKGTMTKQKDLATRASSQAAA